MDFKTAQESKLEIGDIFVVEGIHFKVFITPELSTDFKKYCDHFQIDSFCDQSAIPFSTNGHYEIRALRKDNGRIIWEYPELQAL
jgi:hypothetical protein